MPRASLGPRMPGDCGGNWLSVGVLHAASGISRRPLTVASRSHRPAAPLGTEPNLASGVGAGRAPTKLTAAAERVSLLCRSRESWEPGRDSRTCCSCWAYCWCWHC